MSNAVFTNHLSHTLAEFCELHRISRAALYKLWKLGLGPRYFKVGARTLISAESAKVWRELMEQLTAERPQAQ